MTFSFRCLSAAFLTGGLLLAASGTVLAQGASPAVAPAGGVASTTAPSNSQGTPSGGTGVIGTTQVGPATAVTPPRVNRPRRVVRRTPARRATPASASSTR